MYTQSTQIMKKLILSRELMEEFHALVPDGTQAATMVTRQQLISFLLNTQKISPQFLEHVSNSRLSESFTIYLDV